jgi:signal peptidase II
MSKTWHPLILTVFIVLADQLSKAWVVATIPENTVGHWFFGDFLAIVHVRNTAIAFSMGSTLPIWIRLIFFVALPMALLAAVLLIFFNKNIHLSTPTRWTLALFMGGGIGNLIDRIFRSLRVVDFISVKFYGIFGLERWPTFNIADASLVVSGILLAVLLILEKEVERDGKER